MKWMENYKKADNFIVFRYFIVIIIITGSIIAGTVYLFYNLESKDYVSQLKLEEKIVLKLQVELLTGNFNAVISDLLYLSKQNELSLFFDSSIQKIKKAISTEYLEFSRLKGIYDQVRYLDETGMEIVRVNYNNGQPYIVPEEKLQSKHNRYYFKDSIVLPPSEVFVSPFDLTLITKRLKNP